MRQETIKEAAEEYYIDNIFCDGITEFEHDVAIRCYIAGAKNQAERMYSEEEVRDLILKFNNDKPGIFDASEWFEQFKKN